MSDVEFELFAPAFEHDERIVLKKIIKKQNFKKKFLGFSLSNIVFFNMVL